MAPAPGTSSLKSPAGTVWRFAALIVLAGVFSFATVGQAVLAAQWLDLGDDFRPEVQLPLLLVSGLIALVIALATLVGAFYLFELTDRTKPFGVPEGTLQAVIALTLILIFAITSLFLRGSLDAEHVFVRDLTEQQVANIPGSQILSRQPAGDGLFDVERLVPQDQDAKDFSNQLLTILGTLVGAVAGFYFGAKSVETGVSAGGGNVPPTNTSPPVIGGSPLVGETLRSEPGGWTGSPAPTYGYQWQRGTGEEGKWRNLPGASTVTYLLTPEDAGGQIRIVVTATSTAGTESAESSPTDKIEQSPVMTESPKIEGDSREGGQLRASRGTWSASPEPSFSYQWERSAPGSDDWQLIPQVKDPTYAPARDDVGQRLRVQVTASNPRGIATAPSSATDVISGPVRNTSPPSVTGNARVGETLHAADGVWSGWPLSLTYQWERAAPDTDIWTPIPNALERDYGPQPEDVGKQLRVAVFGGDVQASSAPTEPVIGPPINLRPPTVSGSAKVGEELTAGEGTWQGWPQPTFSFQWQRRAPDATEWSGIPSTTERSYGIMEEDLGAQLRVIVTASNMAGTESKEAESTPPVTAAGTSE